MARLYKDLVLRAWNEQYSDSAERVKQLNRQREDLEDFKQKITEKFINDKISEAERDMQLRAAGEKMALIEEDLEQARDYLEVNEELVERAMLFISAPDEFWNRANTSVKQMIQSLLFPNGVIYDFETGFGTFEKLDSYLLIKKIPHQNGEEVSLVAATGNDPVTSSL